MRLLLTSAGLTNSLLVEAFESLVDVPKKAIHIAYVPTAANIEAGDKGWLIDDLSMLNSQGYGCVDIVDISAVSQSVWEPRIRAANVLYIGGGNTFHLMYWVATSGLLTLLPKLLESRVYVGVSAGSCIAGPTIDNSLQNLFGEKNEYDIKVGLELVNFHFVPHLNSPYFESIREQTIRDMAVELTEPVYACDDTSAVRVVDGTISAVSTGKYFSLHK